MQPNAVQNDAATETDAKNSVASALIAATFHIPGVPSRNRATANPNPTMAKMAAIHAEIFTARSRRATFSG